MSQQHFGRLMELFQESLELTPVEREQLLAGLGEDEHLRPKLASMIAGHDKQDNFLHDAAMD